MFDTIGGLPLHPLVVHAVEVVVPAAALTVLVAAFWPRFRRWAFALPLLLALGAVALVPVATESGEALKERVGEPPLVEVHAEMAEGLLPWVIGLLVVAVGLTWWTWQERRSAGAGSPGGVPRWVVPVVMVGALVAAGGTTYEAIRIGHSGATAVWGPLVESTTVSDDDDDDG